MQLIKGNIYRYIFILGFILINILILGCVSTINEVKKSDKNNDSKIEIIEISEMETYEELEKYYLLEEKNNPEIIEKVKILLSDYEENLRKINLEKISKWAKEEMKGYRLPESFLENIEKQSLFTQNDTSLISFKSEKLPTHNPLVTRNLYIIPLYDNSNNKIIKIFVTIQGFVEE